MKSYLKKKRFYTIVIGRKKQYFVILFAFLLLLLSIYSFKSSIGCTTPMSKGFGAMKKLCLSIKVEEKLDIINAKNLKLIMRHSSSVFLAESQLEEDIKIPDSENIEGKDEDKIKIVETSVSAKNQILKNETDYKLNISELASAQRNYNATGNTPKVLIIHTHACETYTDKNGRGLGSNGSYRSRDNDINMIKIGEAVADVLKKRGINVIHDTTLCDYPSYNNSYVKSLGVIDWYLERYPDIEFVFDLHRDAIAESDGTPKKLCVNTGGKKTAQAMIVCGTDSMGLSHPYWKDNLILALKIQNNLNKMYPELMRPINLRRERFNMHKTKGSLLFEVGSHANTLDEAIDAAKFLAEGIAKTII